MKAEKRPGMPPEEASPEDPDIDLPETAPEDPETAFIDPDKDLEDVASRLQSNSEKIDALKQAMAGGKSNLDAVRASLGLPSLENDSLTDNEKLHALEEERERLKVQEENAKAEKDLENTLKLLAALPKSELKIIIETGKTTDGKQIKTPEGKDVNPDVAKKLAEAAESGATKLTKAVLGAVFAIAKGILKGIFETIKAAAGGTTETGSKI